MEFNKIELQDEHLVLATEAPLLDTITREFSEYTIDNIGSTYLYTFEAKPNMCFALRAMLMKYDVFSVDGEAGRLIVKQSTLATMPVLSLYRTERHVEIQCPPLAHYLDVVATVGAASKGMNTYTVPIARAFDVIRATETAPTYLPNFVLSKSILDVITEPLEGFNGTISSLFEIPIDELKAASSAYRVTPENFNNIGYENVADFLVTQPRRYIDKTQITNHDDLEYKAPVVMIGTIISKKIVFFKHAMFHIRIGGSMFECMYYNRSWMEDKFNLGDEVLVMGEYRGKGSIAGESLESLMEAQSLDIVPIYPQSPKNNITSKIVLNVVYEAIERIKPMADKLTPYINPDDMTMSIGNAINEMHFPSSSESYIGALEALALYELIYLQLLIIHRKINEVKDKGVPKPRVVGGYFDTMIEHLPWDLTPAQVDGLEQMDKYMSSETSEQVLLSADVGAGKSVIAQLACMQSLDNGYQSVLAAPTEVLALQLFDTFTKTINLMPDTMRPTLVFLGGKMKAAEKREVLKYIKTGDIDIIVGTHSVLNASIEYRNLGMVVIDEQQKFGSKQRESLLDSRTDGRKPDLLAQTATPIPRSTAQAFYGDINLISLMGKPEGRIEIETEWLKEDPKEIVKDKMHPIWDDIEKEVAKGHQVFVVVPMVYESKKMDSASVEGAYKNLLKTLPNLSIGYTHGTQKKADQHETMEKFRNNELNILVGSTVIEVGVDIPNATRMIILSADRLGASSLHQIRGRVGRSNLPSICYLVSEGKTPTSQTRLQALVDSSDGFEIAKVDLKTRGEGDLFGIRQAGESTLRFSNLVDHSKLVNTARKVAMEVYNGEDRDRAICDAQSILGQAEEVII